MTQSNSPRHEDLPLPDYDHLPLGTLPTRINGLDEEAVSQLLEYERAHGDRLPIVQVLEHSLDALRNGAVPSGPENPDTPEKTSSSSGSPVSPETSGPPVNPPSQGVPTNPAQPR